MKRINRIMFLTSFITVLFLVVDCNTNGAEPDPSSDSSYTAASETAEIGKSGGTISLKTAEGYTLTLSIPQDAIAGTVQVKLTALSARIEKAIGNNLFPGISIEPLELRLKEPATLKIQFPEKKKLSDEALLYSVAEKDFVLPLSDQKVESSTNTISGSFCLFRQYAAGIPSRKEIDAQIHKLKISLDLEKLSAESFTATDAGMIPVSYYNRQDTGIGMLMAMMVWPPRRVAAATAPAANKKYDCHGWQDTYDEVGALMKWAQRYTLMGNGQAAAEAEELAKNALERAIKSFLERKRPSNNCADGYIRAAVKYAELSHYFSGYQETHDALMKRMNQLLDECAVRVKLTIDRETKADHNEKETGKTSGDVTCHPDSYRDVLYLGGESSWTGEGKLDYEYDYEWKYNSAFGWTRTKSEAGRIEVACSGHTYMKTAVTGFTDTQAATIYAAAAETAAVKCAGAGAASAACIQAETAKALKAAAETATDSKQNMWIRITLKFKPLISGVACDTKPSDSPQCEDYEITKWTGPETYDMPFKDGHREGVDISNPKNGVTGHSYTTLHIIRADLSDPDNDSGCY